MPKLIAERGECKSRPILSVVIAAYNHENYIAECIKSVTSSKHHASIELIIIDDGSVDETIHAASSAIDGFTGRYLIFSKSNAGLTDSLDIGLNISTGEFISFIASDDKYITNGLDEAIECAINKNLKSAATIYQAHYMGSMQGPVYGVSMENLFRNNPSEVERIISLEYPKPLLLQSTIFDRDFLALSNPWRDKLLLDDWPTFIRVAQEMQNSGGTFSYDGTLAICKYRVHAGGIHNNLERQIKACVEVASVVIREEYRAESMSNVYLDRSLNYMAKGKVWLALRLIIRGYSINPSFKVISRISSRIFRKVFRLKSDK